GCWWCVLWGGGFDGGRLCCVVLRDRLGPRIRQLRISAFFFFNDTPPTEIYTLSLHDALPISTFRAGSQLDYPDGTVRFNKEQKADRKSTRLNSSHVSISYAVFCLKKKKSTTPAVNARHHLRPAFAALAAPPPTAAASALARFR